MNKPTAMTNRQLMANADFISKLQVAMPETFRASRLARVAITAMTRTPKLELCDQGTIARCLLDLASLGLEPDGRHAHLIPFSGKNGMECQLIIDYKGYVQLLYRSGLILSIHADAISEGDDFAYTKGIIERHTKWEWRPKHLRPEMRGELIGFYCIVRIVGGGASEMVLTTDEVDAVRRRSKAANNGPWVTDYAEMAKKTVFKRLCKWMPISAEIRNAIEMDDRDDAPATQASPTRFAAMIGRDESRTIDAVATTTDDPVWANDLDEMQILLLRAETEAAIFEIEAAFSGKHDDPAWAAAINPLLRSRAKSLGG